MHHFLPGIAIAFATGATGILTHRRGFRLSLPFGSGVALTLDELPLLLGRDNPYWGPRAPRPHPRHGSRERRGGADHALLSPRSAAMPVNNPSRTTTDRSRISYPAAAVPTRTRKLAATATNATTASTSLPCSASARPPTNEAATKCAGARAAFGPSGDGDEQSRVRQRRMRHVREWSFPGHDQASRARILTSNRGGRRADSRDAFCAVTQNDVGRGQAGVPALVLVTPAVSECNDASVGARRRPHSSGSARALRRRRARRGRTPGARTTRGPAPAFACRCGSADHRLAAEESRKPELMSAHCSSCAEAVALARAFETVGGPVWIGGRRVNARPGLHWPCMDPLFGSLPARQCASCGGHERTACSITAVWATRTLASWPRVRSRFAGLSPS